MSTLEITFFPFPHFIDGKMLAGSLLPWPEACKSCKHRICRNATVDKLNLCSYGYNYQRANTHITVGGILVREYPISSKARSKRFRSESKSIISRAILDSCIQSVRQYDQSIQQDFKTEKERLIERYVQEEQYKTDFLAPLCEQIQKGLSFVHDYKQINTQISQNINVIIEQRYSGESIEEKLNKATREERAIYEAAKFLDEKLNTAKFLMHPEWLDLKEECKKFRFHGLVIKYRRIYSPRFENKNISVALSGQSHLELIANPGAVSVIPHTFFDNAAKYSPKNGRVEIYLQDIDDGIEFEVSSYGPRILPKEEQQIFQPFYRGEAARRAEEEGSGYGLYLSQMIAKNHLGSIIKLEQEVRNTGGKGHWTTFSIRIPLRAAIL